MTETPMMNPMTVPMMTDPIDSSYHNGFYDEFY